MSAETDINGNVRRIKIEDKSFVHKSISLKTKVVKRNWNDNKLFTSCYEEIENEFDF